MEDIPMLNYKEVLERINGKENHLLIANGFNYGLGINTGYKAIFQKMAENNNSIYNDAFKLFEDSGFDLEEFIGKLKTDINPDNTFLKKYVNNKVKLDFMQATHEIVKSEIKNIYAEKNEGIYLLLKHFDNYFTLNYDSFLYLLLLKYKPIEIDKKNVIVFQPSLKFKKEDLDLKQDNIYTEIKDAREKGILEINFGNKNNILEKDFKYLTKTHFTAEVKEYSKSNNKGWKTNDINRVIKSIIEEENRLFVLNSIDDGSKQLNMFDEETEFIMENRKTQNLFFLHGAFHIYKDGNNIKKITQESDKALYDKLEEVLNNEEQEIVCVFQNENKTDVINDNKYLKNCLQKLGQISGNLVIIGCSLADNDNHIFDKINNSKINTVYISSMPENITDMLKTAKSKFPDKDIFLFDAKTISYEMPTGIINYDK